MAQSMTSAAGSSKKRKTAPDSDPGTPSPKKKRIGPGRATARKSTGGRPPRALAAAAAAQQQEPGAAYLFPFCPIPRKKTLFTETQSSFYHHHHHHYSEEETPF
jgi:hypothetical protein